MNENRKQFIRRCFIIRDGEVILRERPRRDFATRHDHQDYNARHAGRCVSHVTQPFTMTVKHRHDSVRVLSYEILLAYDYDRTQG